jgi:hypothetical protein
VDATTTGTAAAEAAGAEAVAVFAFFAFGSAEAGAGTDTFTSTSGAAALVLRATDFTGAEELIIPGVEEVWEDILRVISILLSCRVSNFISRASISILLFPKIWNKNSFFLKFQKP